MAESTGISWCDATFNPWIGCEKVSAGCKFCYAEELVTKGRLHDRFGDTWGPTGRRARTSAETWKKPLRWERLAQEGKLPDRSPNPDGHRPRVFCASLADVFEPRPELSTWRAELFDLIAATPSLDWLLLTKRPEEARDWLWLRYSVSAREALTSERPLLPTNVWLGVSIENARHTWRADVLREIPAAVRFISAEPLLGSLFEASTRVGPPETFPNQKRPLDLTGIDWLIVGGESGGREARPMHPDWARELRDACLAIGEPEMVCCQNPGPECCGRYLPTGECCGDPVQSDECCGDFEPGPEGPRPAFFFKQWGSWAPLRAVGDTYVHGGSAPAMAYYGPGPTSGGKLLDGREWAEFPASAAKAVFGSLF